MKILNGSIGAYYCYLYLILLNSEVIDQCISVQLTFIVLLQYEIRKPYSASDTILLSPLYHNKHIKLF